MSGVGIQPCFHCGEPSAPCFSAPINNAPAFFCCLGCQAVAVAIDAGGLGQFYRYREHANAKPDTPSAKLAADYETYDLDAVQSDFVAAVGTPLGTPVVHRAALNIDGISCAACIWLIEKHLHAIKGVTRVSINASTHQGFVEYYSAQVKISQIFAALSHIGFKPSPSVEQGARQQWQQRQRQAMLRLGVAGIGMMQAGMVAIALHAGDIQGIGSEWQDLLRWASLIMATPVLLYSGYPFFAAAWRALKWHHLTMDVPVSLALILAYVASAYATVSQTGDVYFDSVAMFIFFLLLGRFLEQRVRYKNFLQTGQWQQLIPLTAIKKYAVSATEPERKIAVPVKSLAVGDWVWVASGETFPCDGEVMEGQSSADESLLTGEADPQLKQVGNTVVAGSQNIESGLWVKVTALGQQTCLADIDRLVQSAASARPKQVAFADKLAGVFVARVLIVTVLVAVFWFFYDASRALWVTLSVLVVTCPCALTLATPAALTGALSALRRHGILVTSGTALEQLENITDVVFDKTGTLTEGHLSLEAVKTVGPHPEDLKAIAAALQRVSSHPIARAFAPFNQSSMVVKQAKNVTSQGVEGVINGQQYRMGRPSFCVEGAVPDYPADGLWVALAQGQQLIGWFSLGDKVRDAAPAVLEAMGLMGCQRHLLSGDRHSNVVKLQQELTFDVALAEQAPADKLRYVQSLQNKGRKVLMVGDGINDVPVLAAANVSIAMGQASELAKLQADIILLTNDLLQIPRAVALSSKVIKIIKQNLAWALAYNLLALPLAMAGFVPPWLAAIGMSLSSLVVVLNALRLAR